MNTTAPAPGTVYLIHFDTPYKRARHYIGWTADLDARLKAHRTGHGARLMEVIAEAGITWQLARTWDGGRTRERAIKNRKNAPRLCPLCTSKPLPVLTGRSGPPPAPAAIVLPVPVQISPRERGLRQAEQFLSQRTGWNPDRLADAFAYITGPYRDMPRHTPGQDEEFGAFSAAVTGHITRLRTAQIISAPGGQS